MGKPYFITPIVSLKAFSLVSFFLFFPCTLSVVNIIKINKNKYSVQCACKHKGYEKKKTAG